MDKEVERLTSKNDAATDERRFGQRNPTEIAEIPDGPIHRTAE